MAFTTHNTKQYYNPTGRCTHTDTTTKQHTHMQTNTWSYTSTHANKNNTHPLTNTQHIHTTICAHMQSHQHKFNTRNHTNTLTHTKHDTHTNQDAHTHIQTHTRNNTTSTIAQLKMILEYTLPTITKIGTNVNTQQTTTKHTRTYIHNHPIRQPHDPNIPQSHNHTLTSTDLRAITQCFNCATTDTSQ